MGREGWQFGGACSERDVDRHCVRLNRKKAINIIVATIAVHGEDFGSRLLLNSGDADGAGSVATL